MTFDNNNNSFSSMTEKTSFLLNILCKSHGGLHVCHINPQSLVNKIDEFRLIFENSSIDIICVSETWFDANINSEVFSLKGFRLYRADRHGRIGGGAAIYVRNTIKSKHLHCSNSTNNSQFYFVEILNGENKCVIGTIYMAPDVSHSSIVGDIIEEISCLTPKIIICGDFNMNLLNMSSNSLFKNTMRSLNLFFLNSTDPTHFKPNCSPSLLDVILTSDESIVKCYSQLSVPVFLYHDLVFATFNVNVDRSSSQPIQYRDFRSINVESLFSDCLNIEWCNIYLSSDVNKQVEFLNVSLEYLFSKHVPCKTRVLKTKSCPWFSTIISDAMKRRDLLYRRWKRFRCTEMHAEYIASRNHVTCMIKTAKFKYYSAKFNSDRSSKFLWNRIREIGLCKKNVPAYNEDIDLEELNNRFITSVPSSAFNSPSILTPNNSGLDGFALNRVDLCTVGMAILSVKCKSVGLDNIHPDFIKILLPFILPHITHIYNTILMTSTYPTIWKKAKIVPIPKKANVPEYRPIAILPFLSKVFESILSRQIKDYIEGNKLLTALQSGFRSGHSCITALLKVSDDIRQAIDEDKTTLLALLDFSKAFDCVNPSILCNKLSTQFNFSVPSNKLIYSYLTNRVQAVSNNSKMSSFRAVNRGVPQGSILGPLLFTMFINDLPTVLSHCNFHIYADDVQLYLSFPIGMVEDSVAKINDDLRSIMKWSAQNALTLNPEKTKIIPISKHQPCLSNFSPIELYSTHVEYVTQVRNLGIIFNSELTWNNHICAIVSKIYASLRGLSVSKAVLPTDVKLKLVKALIVPIISYGCELFADSDYVSILKLKRALNSTARYVFNLRRYDHVSAECRKLLGCDFDAFLKYRSCILLFKIIHRQQPEYLYNKLTFSRSNRCITIRPSIHTCLTSRRQFFVHAVYLWNHLPHQVRSIIEYRQFSSACFSHFVS